MDEVFRPLRQVSTVRGWSAFRTGRAASVPIIEPRFFIRTAIEPAIMAERVRAAVRSIDRSQPVDSVVTFDGAREQSLAPARLTAILTGLFAAIGVVISTVEALEST
jgi:hypothetical protein